MKFKNIVYSTCFVTMLLVATGCSKKKFDINSNPDEVTDVTVTPTVLLPGALQSTSRLVAINWDWLSMWIGHWARSGSYQSITDVETYRFTNDFKVEIWDDLYRNASNYHRMQTQAEATGAGFYEAIARIMKSHNFGILVDIYNNVPYSDAFKGTANATPKYDKGIDIYKSIFNELDKAIELLETPAAIEDAKNPEIENSDMVFHGDAHEWIKFANTLRLRLLLHLHNGLATTQVVSGIDIQGQVAKITSDGFLNAGESAHLNPGFTATKPNPYYRAFVEDEAGTERGDINRANEYAIDYYKGNADPRISRFYVAPASGHKGSPFGRPSDNTTEFLGSNLSTVRGPGLVPAGAASRAWIITSVESLFLQAEARERGILTTGPSAKELLTAAIRESFVWLGLTATQANAYISANADYPDVDYDAAPIVAGQPGGGLYTILSQKWFALNSIAPFELWTDYRRTDFVLGAAVGFDPGPPISIDPGNTFDKIPRRLLYPQNEYNYNAANAGAEGTINVFSNKIFWDIN